jgi:hypothetical protein
MVHAECCCLGHTPTQTTGAKSPALTREGHDPAVATVVAANAQKAVRRDAAAKVRVDLVEHESGQLAAADFHIGQESGPMLLKNPVKQCLFRSVALIGTSARDLGRLTDRCRPQEGSRQGLSDAQRTSCASAPTEEEMEHHHPSGAAWLASSKPRHQDANAAVLCVLRR